MYSACAAASTRMRSFRSGKSVLRIGNLGMIPNTSNDGTRPFSPIVSLNTIVAHDGIIFGGAVGKLNFTFFKNTA
jgi:hypothetical protein